jgi:hypothetical protein
MTNDAAIATARKKLWTLRLASIPALLLLPLACAGIAVAYADKILEDDFPLGLVMLATAAGIVAMIPLSLWTVFARQNSSFKRGFRVLAGLAAFDLLGPFVTILLCSWIAALSAPMVYDRASVRINSPVPPNVNVSGTWKGSWTDPRMKFTQIITLTLTQQDNQVTGSMIDDELREWRIAGGVVSGDELDLFYDREFAWQPTRGATLRGVITNNSIAGKYYGHERPRRGWASTGTWVAIRADP